MQFSCESCKAQLQLADERLRGKRLIVRCRRCGAKIALADPAISKSPPRLISGPPGPAAAVAPAAAAPPRPEAQPKSDVEITRAMESDVLERALQASAADGASRNGAMAAQEPAAGAQEQAAPPPADGAIWFAMLHGKQTGPLTRAELDVRADEGEVGPRTYLWREGMDSWQRAKDVPELASMFPQFPGAPPSGASLATPPPQTPPPPRPTAEGAQAGAERAQEPQQGRVPDAVLAAERAKADQVARDLFASGEHSISQKNALDLARWATDELGGKREPELPRIPPPVVAPTPMFEGAAASRGKGAVVIFLGLALLAATAVVLFILLGSAPDHGDEPARAPQAEPQTPPPPRAPEPKAAEPRPEAKPDEAVPQPPAAPAAGLTAEQVRRKLDEGKPALQACIDDALRRDPRLRVGKIHVATTISPSGQVTAARIDNRAVDESPLGTCLKRATKKIAFPAFAGSAFDVDIPIVVSAGE